MFIMFNVIVLALALTLGAAPLVLTARLKRRLPALLRTDQMAAAGADEPTVSIVLPCKGIDPGFEANIAAVLAQDWSALELVFVVATPDDAAVPVLRAMLSRRDPDGTCTKVVIAGVSSQRAQKLTNQLAAVEAISTDREILVFLDSDCRPDQEFVRRLIGPLARPEVGATTGYRWYHPPAPSLGSMLRSTWNAGALPFLADTSTAHAWGGAMAIRRDVFHRARVPQVWDHAVSDDLTLTVAIRRLGLRLNFVPSCIAVSYEESSVAQTLEFTNRQSLISRVYLPPLWWGAALGHSALNVLIAYGLINAVCAIGTGNTAAWIGSCAALLLPLQMVNALWLFSLVLPLLPERIRPEVGRLRWHYVVTAPLASLMSLINTVHSATTRRLTWRGVTYELRSPTETAVVSSTD